MQKIKLPLLAIALVLISSIFVQAQTPLGFTTNSSLPSGQIQQGYNTTITVVGGSGQKFFNIISGGLPQGLSLGLLSGTIAGTPAVTGTFNFTVRVNDALQNSISQEFTLVINSNQLAVSTTALPNATLNQSYSANVQASGGIAPYTFTLLSGSLPPGLTFNNGAVTGTPTQTGSFSISVRVNDSTSPSGSNTGTVTLLVGATSTTIGITTTALPNAQVGQVYNTSLGASNGTAPYSFSLALGSLPPGLQLFSSGQITGTATQVGTYQMTFRVTDANNSTATSILTIQVFAGSLSITSTLPTGTLGQAYNTTLTAAGGSAPYSFTIIAGQLPPGLNFNTGNGTISGTPTQAGNYQITFRVTDTQSGTAQATLNLNVLSTNLNITTTTLPNGQVGSGYNNVITSSGGVGQLSYSIVGGGLPPGISLATSTGSLVGTPTTPGTYLFTVRVSDTAQGVAERELSITINSNVLGITTTSLPGAQVGIPYIAALNAGGGTGSIYFYSIVSGSLPPGVTLTDTGQFGGTPTTPGTYPITFRVTDGFSSAQRQLSITVTVPALTLSTTVLPNGVVNQAYNSNVVAVGGSGGYTFSVLSGNLPNGVTLANNGALSGVPTVAGSFTFTVRVQDSVSSTAQSTLTINVNSLGGFTITTSSLPNGQVNVSYSANFTASGGVGNLTYSLLSGSLPAGLFLNSNGTIFGTPSTNGSSSFTIRVTDGASNVTQSSFTITITPNVLTLSNTSLPNGQTGVQYSSSVVATGGVFPYSFTILSGSLPPGLNLNSSSGLISGTPGSSGSFFFQVRVTDASGGFATQQFSINVGAPSLNLTNTTLPAGQLNVNYSFNLTGVGGTGSYFFSVVSGQLPSGLTLSSSGQLFGVPAQVGVFNLTFRLTDSSGAFVQVNLNLTISSTLFTITTTSLPQAVVNQTYSTTLSASGGTTPYTFFLLSSTPAGMNFSSTGILSGTPQQSGTFPLLFRVTDANGNSTQTTLNFNVNLVGLSISNSSLPNAALGSAYTVTLNGVGGTSPYTFSLASGPLPVGFSLSSGGVLSGTASTPGNFPLTIRITDANGNTAQSNFTLVIGSSTITITPTTLSSAVLNQTYSATFVAAGGSAPYTYTIINGALPLGLNLTSQGLLSGAATQSGSFNFTLRASDSAGSTGQFDFTLTVTLTAPTFSTSSLPDGNVGASYTAAVVATSASASALTYTIASGSLPPGVSLGSNGNFSGSPSTAGLFTFTVQVSDAQGATAQRQFSINITAGGGPLSISAAVPTSGRLYYPYSFRLSGVGGFQPYTWSLIAGTPPSGLRLDPSSGNLSGVPLAQGFYTFSVRLTDSRGTIFDAPAYTIAIVEATRLSNGRVGQAYSAQFPAGGRPPLNFTIEPSAIGGLPPGITLSAAGFFSGTPTASGEFTFGVNVRDADGVTSQNAVTLPVSPSSSDFPDILSLPGASAGTSYRQQLRPSGEQIPSGTVLSAGTLPPGINLEAANAALSGTPTTPGDYFFTLSFAGGGLSGTNSASFRLTVAPAGSPVLAALTNAASYASNGVAPGQLITLFGSGMGPAALQQFTVSNNLLPKDIASTRVLFDGVPAAMIYTSAGQVSAIAPFGLLGRVNTNVTVEFNRTVSAPLLLPVLNSQPAIFTIDGSGTGQGAILNQNGSVNGPTNPAARGSVVVLYATGGGRMTPSGVDGRVASAVSSLFQPTAVQIGGQTAELVYAGNAPGIVEGVIQVNARVPQTAATGSQPLRFSVGGNLSPAGVVLWVQ